MEIREGVHALVCVLVSSEIAYREYGRLLTWYPGQQGSNCGTPRCNTARNHWSPFAVEAMVESSYLLH